MRAHFVLAALDHFDGTRRGNADASGIGSSSDASASREQHIQRWITNLTGKKS
jgi:hypothetical protein